MSIANACRRVFTPSDRERGQRCFEQGRVLLHKNRSPVEARVRGSSWYHVKIEFDDFQDAFVSCDCPRHGEGHFCEHLWATLLEIDRSAAGEFPSGKQLNVYRWDGLLGNSGVPVPNHATSSGSRPALPPPGSLSSRSRWRDQLTHVAHYAHPSPEKPSSNIRGAFPSARQPWFVLNIGATLQDGELVVDLYEQVQRKIGDWGKIKPLSVDPNHLPHFQSSEHDQLFQMMVKTCGVQTHESMRFMFQARINQCVVDPWLYDRLLPALCKSGQFRWLLERDLPVEEGVPIVWHDGPPWQLRLQVETNCEAERWEIRGVLEQGGQQRSLDEAVLLLAGGVILFEDHLARFECGTDFGWVAALRRSSMISVPFSDRHEFLEQFWSLPQLPAVELPDELQAEVKQMQPRGRLSIRAPQTNRQQLEATAHFLYGDHELAGYPGDGGLYDVESGCVVQRDRQHEQTLHDQLYGLGLAPRFDGEATRMEIPFTSLADVVQHLVQSGWVVESEGLRIRRAGGLSLNVRSQIDWFELHGEAEFDGAAVSLPRLLRAVRNRDRFIRLDDGSQGILPDEWLQRFESLANLGELDEDQCRFKSSQALLLDALLAEQSHVQLDQQFRKLRERLHSFNGVKPAKVPRAFRGELRPYQKEGLGWLKFLEDFGFGGCLADDMGLGKTVQVLALLERERSRRKKEERPQTSIAVVPKSLVYNWMEEAARFTPKLRVFNYTGFERKGVLQQLDQYDLLITTYGTMRRDVVALLEHEFNYAILDEAQAIKNAQSQAAKAARLLKARRRLAMTGTPVENHLGELWSLFEFLNPGMLGRAAAFRQLLKNNGDEHAVKTLSHALRPFLLRRTKENVLDDLPEKNEQTLHCEMNHRDRRLYDELRDYYRARLTKQVESEGMQKSRFHVLEALLRLRQAACHPGLLDEKKRKQSSAKLDCLLEQLQEVIDEGHKALVFSQFTSMLSIVRERLDREGICYEYLDGKTTRRGRHVKRFQEDDHCRVFLISLKAGGHGLNLTAADYVFLLDPWWNPAVETQAIDRAHRIGQQRKVFAYRLICRDTVEDRIVELQREKRHLADAILAADKSLIGELTSEDLAKLLS